MTEGKKMWLSVMAIFLAYATIFILFQDYDRKFLMLFDRVSDWHFFGMPSEWMRVSAANRPRKRIVCDAS